MIRLLQMIAAISLLAVLPVWSADNPNDYPIRLQFASAQFSDGYASGKATLVYLTSHTKSAVDYSGSCSPFSVSPTAAKLMSPATWKKEGSKLRVFWTELGKENRWLYCDFDIYNILAHQAYVTTSGGVRLVSQEELDKADSAMQSMQNDLHPTDTDPSHYPLRVVFLAGEWSQGAYGFTGQGKGDISQGEQVNGFEFAATCAIKPGVGPEYSYAGKWVEGNTRLCILAHSTGEANQARQCELQTELRSFVYVRNPQSGVISTMSQGQYQEWRQKRKAAQNSQSQSSQGETPATSKPSVTPVPTQKISVGSTPQGADIEVDGVFMGSTPSVIEISIGEHDVVIRKSGYNVWERKLKLGAGDVNINADLEKKTSQR